jgi:uncharacterized membrane protein (UPF0127 family)
MGKKTISKENGSESAFLLKLMKIFAVALVVAIVLKFLPIQDWEFRKMGKIKIGTQVLIIEYASGSQQVTKGLSGRKELPKDQGMFFTFPTDGNYGFWMKDMLFPIDIIFVGSDYKIVDILYNAPPCGSGECPSFSPPEKFRYVLEVNSGWSKENELKIGDQFEIIK